MSGTTVQIVANPDAGSASRRRLRALERAFKAAGAHVILSESRSGGVDIAVEADHVCVVGGDGTLRHVLAAVRRAGRSVTLSLFPMGTVNLIARERGYSRDPATFVARALAGGLRYGHHVGLLGETILSGVASVGPDSLAVAGLSPRLKRRVGRLAYLLSFLALLGRWPRPQLCVATPDREIACEAVYVAKGRYFAGPWSFAPQASVEEPLLHVVALRSATRRDFARFVWALWRGHPLAGRPNLILFSCTELTIDGDTAPFQADGDIVATLPVHVTIASDILHFA
ncbi:diacylglycerol/lipid kinase family protein [Sphingomonas crusticola]|uniref:diacylglycerol/lipid kinase family protein n=1 Tax=Sphingomonas crusticola TaxID=1697973 RepID=UPI000E254EAF|nr:diacylglycerol kinase family protein [Sphingomonas crusticola]